MNKIKTLLKNPQILTMVFLCFVLLFCFNSNAISGERSFNDMVFPYIDVNLTCVFFVISIISIMLILVQKKLLFDKISILLLLRIPLYFIPLLYISDNNFKIGIAYAVVQCFFAYIIGISYDSKLSYIVNILLILSVFISMEVFCVPIITQLSIFNPDIKWYMTIPLGKHNFIASILVPLYAFVLSYYKRNVIFAISYSIFIGISIIVIGSRGGFLVFILTTIILFADIIRKIRINKRNAIIVLMIALSLFIAFYNKIISLFSQIISRYHLGLMNSRISVYINSIKTFALHPLFGRSAFQYISFFDDKYDVISSHNLIIESLVQTGIFGTILYLICLYLVGNRLRKIKDKDVRRGYLTFFFVFLFYGMFEPNLFNSRSDFLFWLVLGTGIAISNKDINAKTYSIKDYIDFILRKKCND